MKHLSIAARVLTPLAMVTFLTIEITQSQNLPAPLIYVIAIAAFFTSVGLEAWGVMAGQNLERAWRMNRGKWSTALMLILYASVSVYLLRTNSTLVVLPIVAALVYVSAALSDSLETAVSQQDEQTAVQQAFDLEQLAADRATDRQIKIERARAKMQPPRNPATQPSHATGQPVGPEVGQLPGTRGLVAQAYQRNPGATQQEIADWMLNQHGITISRQAVSKHKRSLNGVLK